MKEKTYINSSKKEYIGLIKINQDNNQKDYLKIYTNSNADELAYNFCLKNKLNFEIVKKLITKINFMKDNNILLQKEKNEFSFNISNSIKNKENYDVNGLNNYLFNGYDLTPINSINNKPINNLYDTEEGKLDILSQKFFYNGNKRNEEFFEGNKNDFHNDKKYNEDNSFTSYNLNESLNDKLNNLEKAYKNYNPEFKSSNELKFDNNTKEIIESTIKECMTIMEKEENNKLDILSSEKTKNNIGFDRGYNSDQNGFNKSNINTKNYINNYLYSTPKLKQNESFNVNSLNKSLNINKFNYTNTEKYNFIQSKNKIKEDKLNIKENEKENLNLEELEIIKTIPKINYNINNNIEINQNAGFDSTNNHNLNNNNNFKIFNNISIKHEMEFSLINNNGSNKIRKKTKNNSKKLHLINRKLCRLRKTKNNISSSQNKNYISYNEYNKSNYNTTTNYSSLKTIPNNEKENPIYSTIKTTSNYDLLSSNISDKSTNAQNRETLISNLNYSNNILIGSTYNKLSKNKNSFNSELLNKLNKNKNFTFSNKFLLQSQKQTENKKIESYKNINNKTIINQSNKINIKNINKKIKIRKKKKLIILNNNNISNNSFKNNNEKNKKSKTIENTSDYLSYKSQSHAFYRSFKNLDKYNIFRNKIRDNLLEKNEILNCFKNIFYIITKNSETLDAFSMVNKNNIPSPIYEIVKNIISTCHNKIRFVEYKDFINKALSLVGQFSKEEKASILNYNKYF